MAIAKLAGEKLCLVYGRRGLPATVFRLHGVFSQERLAQFGQMIERALAGEPLRVIRGAGGEYVHLDDALRALLLAAGRPEAYGEVLNLAGTYTYHEPDLARTIVERAGSRSQVACIEDPLQEMISVSLDKIERVLGFRPERGEFFTSLIQRALDPRRQLPLARH